MSQYHAVVWIDHSEARVMHITLDDFEKSLIHGQAHPHLHHKRGVIGSGRAAEDHAFYEKVVAALKGAQEILIVGPASAKEELSRHIAQHHHDMAPKIVGIETVDHPSDGQLLVYARKYFRAADRMRPA
ncbi:MAG TPA: translational machinery protein [Burkholderiales bacterium]|nr:translational machinery protein [Burkholderiales bacterium]